MAKKRASSRSHSTLMPPLIPVLTEKTLADHGASEALKSLSMRGVDKDRVLQLLSLIPYAPDEKQRLVKGMTDRSFRTLPSRIRTCADTIDEINASIWFDPSQLPRRAKQIGDPGLLPRPLNLIFSSGWPEPTAHNFQRLPHILRLYADYLRAHLELFERSEWNTRILRRGFRPRTMLTCELLQLVEDVAKRPCYPQIATLLTTAYTVAGKNRVITEDDLAKLKQNNPVLWWPRFFRAE